MQIAPHNLARNTRAILIFMALAALFISFSQLSLTILDQFGTNRILDDNMLFLEETSIANHKDMLRLTEILAVVKLISTTDIGVSLILKAEIEVGQALHGLTRSIEYALWVVLASSVVIEVWRLLVETAEVLSLWFFRASLLAIAFYILSDSVQALGQLREHCFRFMQFTLLLFTTTFLLIPYTLNLTTWLNHVLLRPSTQEQKRGLGALHDTVANTAQDTDLTQYWSNGKAIKTHLLNIHSDVHSHTNNVFEFLTNSLAVSIISGVLAPLASFYLLLIIFRWAFSLLTTYHHGAKQN